MRRTVTAAILALPLPVACAHVSPPPPTPAPVLSASTPPSDASAPAAITAPVWPELFAAAMQGRGEPHAQPIPLPRDAQGRDRWIVFVGTSDVAIGAWRVARDPNGVMQTDA